MEFRLKIKDCNVMLNKMKKIIIYNFIALLITTVMMFNGCDSPAPTELVQDNNSGQNPIQVQVITKDTSDSFYNNGFDTTGVSVSDTSYASVIYVSGTKITYNSLTEKISFAQALFFDRSSPVREQNGRLIGYHTLLPGDILFNNHSARLAPYRISYNYMGNHLDTLLGSRYILSSRMLSFLHQFDFNFNSNVNFQIVTAMGKSVSFDIPTPAEVVGKVKLTGKRENNTLAAELDWNPAYSQKIEIILGVVPKNQKSPVPIFKIMANDSGKLMIPTKLLNSIPSNKYDKIVFTFVRILAASKSINGNDILVSSQSIHSIILDIP